MPPIPPRNWIAFAALALLAAIVLGNPFWVALATALLLLLAAAHFWRQHALDGVEYRRRFHYTRAFPGESFPLRVEIENRKWLPLSWLRVEDPWPKAVAPEEEDILAPSHIPDQGYLTNLVSLRWYERARRSYQLLFRQRGVYPVGPATLQSGDLFGLYQSEAQIETRQRLTVFPALLPPEILDLPSEDPFGDRRSQRRLFEDPNRPMGVREYRPEDGFRRVHWPATARAGQLQVKVYQPVSAQVMVVCLNVATFARPWEGIYPPLQEYLVSAAATLVDEGLRAGYKVGLISNGCLSNSDQPFRVPSGRSIHHLEHLLEALAGVTGLVSASFERFLLREMPRVPYGATLVILTALVSPELCETLLRLKRHERRISLLALGKTPPPVLPGIPTIYRPFREAE